MIVHPRHRSLWLLPLLASAALACDPGGGDDKAGTAKAEAAAKTGEAAKAEVAAKADGDGAADGEAKGEAKADGDGAADGAADGAGTKKDAAKKKFAEHDAAEILAARAKMVATLNEGRRLVKEDKLDEGIAKYRELLAIDPHYGPALGELGWAEFKAGQLESARAHTQKALTRAPDDKRRGMLHYNLGRIAEAQDQTEQAIEAYALSLTLRPNKVVAERLATLSHVESAEGFAAEHPAVEAYEATHGSGTQPKPTLLPVAQNAAASVEAACKVLVDNSDDASCELQATPAGDAGWGMIALSYYDIERFWHPAVKTEAGWVVFESALYGQHGSEIDQDVDLVASRIVSNDAGAFLFIEYSDHIYERDWSWGELEEDEEIPDDEMHESKGVIICKRGAKVVCTAPILTYWNYWYGDVNNKFTASVTMQGDRIVIGDVATEGAVEFGHREDEWEPIRPLPAGEYALAELK